MTLFAKRKESSDLARLHAECEMNYVRLHRLLPGMELGTHCKVRHGDQRIAAMCLEVLEITPYTCLIGVVAKSKGPQWLPEIELKVRVYHDARMAEVVEWCSDRTVPWALSEKRGMQSRDEKWQWNCFLRDILSHSLIHGVADAELNVEISL